MTVDDWTPYIVLLEFVMFCQIVMLTLLALSYDLFSSLKISWWPINFFFIFTEDFEGISLMFTYTYNLILITKDFMMTEKLFLIFIFYWRFWWNFSHVHLYPQSFCKLLNLKWKHFLITVYLLYTINIYLTISLFFLYTMYVHLIVVLSVISYSLMWL